MAGVEKILFKLKKLNQPKQHENPVLFYYKNWKTSQKCIKVYTVVSDLLQIPQVLMRVHWRFIEKVGGKDVTIQIVILANEF